MKRNVIIVGAGGTALLDRLKVEDNIGVTCIATVPDDLAVFLAERPEVTHVILAHKDREPVLIVDDSVGRGIGKSGLQKTFVLTNTIREAKEHVQYFDDHSATDPNTRGHKYNNKKNYKRR